MNGLLLINKEKDWTSRDVVNKLTHLLGTKKIGHSGTLDPFAEGLLLVAVNKSLKLLPYLEDLTKTYVARLKLGEKTDTGDYTGEVIERKEVGDISKSYLEKILDSFLGESEQIPPMYSALKKDGVPLYKLARQGVEVERKPRKITISKITLLSFKDNIVEFEVDVSKGTYIRTLGEDIASKLGTCGHLLSLKRTRIGEYKLENSKHVHEISSSDIIDFDDIKLSVPSLEIKDEDLLNKVIHGATIKLDSNHDIILLVSNNKKLAIYERKNNDIFHCRRGLV